MALAEVMVMVMVMVTTRKVGVPVGTSWLVAKGTEKGDVETKKQ